MECAEKMKTEITVGKEICDYKAKIFYHVIAVSEIADNRLVMIASVRVSKMAPTSGYDVIILRPDRVIPDSEKWGEEAWSFSTQKQAEIAMAEICSKTPYLDQGNGMGRGNNDSCG
jgi:hypothetical protein